MAARNRKPRKEPISRLDAITNRVVAHAVYHRLRSALRGVGLGRQHLQRRRAHLDVQRQRLDGRRRRTQPRRSTVRGHTNLGRPFHQAFDGVAPDLHDELVTLVARTPKLPCGPWRMSPIRDELNAIALDDLDPDVGEPAGGLGCDDGHRGATANCRQLRLHLDDRQRTDAKPAHDSYSRDARGYEHEQSDPDDLSLHHISPTREPSSARRQRSKTLAIAEDAYELAEHALAQCFQSPDVPRRLATNVSGSTRPSVLEISSTWCGTRSQRSIIGSSHSRWNCRP